MADLAVCSSDSNTSEIDLCQATSCESHTFACFCVLPRFGWAAAACSDHEETFFVPTSARHESCKMFCM